jgi:macrolide transport system ATP-binding/permease protein
LMRGLYRAQTIDPGFQMKNIAVASFNLTASGYSPQRSEAFQRQLTERVIALPGIVSVAQVGSAPLSNSHFGDLFSTPGQEGSSPVEFNCVSPGYFPLLNIPIVRGRNFTDAENRIGAQVAIVTESTARRFWPGKDPIGKTFRKGALRPDAVDLEVIGVARDAQVSHLAQSDNLYVYLTAGPKEQSGLQLLVHSPRGNAAMAGAIRAAVRALDPELIVNVTRLENNFDYFRFPGRVVATLSGVLGALALLLASMGVYGMVAYVVSRRVREIGIRMALGAEGDDVTALIVRQALRPVAIGIVIGVAGCAAISTILSSVLYGISPRDPVSFVLVPGFLLAIATLASYLPARRAAKVDPMEALRYE